MRRFKEKSGFGKMVNQRKTKDVLFVADRNHGDLDCAVRCEHDNLTLSEQILYHAREGVWMQVRKVKK